MGFFLSKSDIKSLIKDLRDIVKNIFLPFLQILLNKHALFWIAIEHSFPELKNTWLEPNVQMGHLKTKQKNLWFVLFIFMMSYNLLIIINRENNVVSMRKLC